MKFEAQESWEDYYKSLSRDKILPRRGVSLLGGSTSQFSRPYLYPIATTLLLSALRTLPKFPGYKEETLQNSQRNTIEAYEPPSALSTHLTHYSQPSKAYTQSNHSFLGEIPLQARDLKRMGNSDVLPGIQPSSPSEVITRSIDYWAINLTYWKTLQSTSIVDLEADRVEANMALILLSPQKSDSRSTQHTKKNSSTSNHRNKNQIQNESKKYNQDFDPQTSFGILLRKWPTWPDIDYLAQKAANIDNVTNETSNAYLSPMERWRIETQQQSPWNGIAAVTTVKQERYGNFEGSPQDGTWFGDTDIGSWTPVFETV